MVITPNLSSGPGDPVPHEGVYAVLHAKPHAYYTQLFVGIGTFPRCSVCGAQVTFRLIQPVENISEDADFMPDAAAIRKTA